MHRIRCDGHFLGNGVLHGKQFLSKPDRGLSQADLSFQLLSGNNFAFSIDL